MIDRPLDEQTAPLLVVSGPTACGKTGLAVRLCKIFKGDVVNIDSVQIYQGMDIGSAKARLEEMQGVPHHLLSYLQPSQQGTAAQFVDRATETIAHIQETGRQVVLAGGTTMYLTGLLHGFADLPERQDERRLTLEALTGEELWARLEAVDPGSAQKLHVNDRVRVIRAIEASEITGTPYSSLLEAHRYQGLKFNGISVVLCRQRRNLYDRIDLRTKRMLEDGLVEETRGIVEKFGESAPPLATLGYAQARAFLKGELPEEELEGQIARQTRRFAKRQMTFWRNEPQKRGWQIRRFSEYPSVQMADEPGEYSQKGPQRQGFQVFQLSFDELCNQINTEFDTGVQGHQVWYVDADLLE